MLEKTWRLLAFVVAIEVSTVLPSDSFFGISIRRDDRPNTCYHNGGQHPCTFFLFCSLAGGTSVGSCPGSLLSSCCVAHQANNVRRSPPQPSNRHSHSLNQHSSSSNHRPYKRDKGICGRRVHKPQSRIVGGNDAQFGEFPWQAHIKITQQQCGGVLLNHYYVLTAAHCVYRALLQDMIVVLGAYDIHDQTYQVLPAQRFRVVEKKLHPSFRFSPSHPDRYDVALLKLDRAVKYQDNVVPICLPPYGWNFQGWKAVITGWGKTDPALSNRYGTRVLQKVEVPIISNRECESWHHWKGINVRIFPEMICAGYENGRKDACVGDSGGPLMVQMDGRWTLVGVISAGFGCAQWRQPGIYHSVSTTVDWISSNLREKSR